ncbi:hypothetical protein ABK046_47095, partial [Streptomyces caeruleatus]
QIINDYISGKTLKELGNEYGLWDTNIGNIIRGKTWKSCTRPDNIKEIISDRAKQSQFQKGLWDEYHNTFPSLSDRQIEIINGSLLGDGS